VSTWEKTFDPPSLKAAGVKEIDRPQRMIQQGFGDWRDWFRISWANPHHAQAVTRKLTDPKWRGPAGAKLTLDVRDPDGGALLMTFNVNQWGAYAGVKAAEYYCVKPLMKTSDWQTVKIDLADLKPRQAGRSMNLKSWQGITELGIVAGLHHLPDSPGVILSGEAWPGKRQLRNLRWTGGDYTEPLLYPGGTLSVENFKRMFQDDIDKSIELESKDLKTSSKDGR
jgi:hypothetical protein